MESRYYLQCLGTPTLVGPDGEPVRIRVRKHLALLIYLAVEPLVRRRREELVELLWPNAKEGEGRHSLSTALSVIRARLGRDALEADFEHVRFASKIVDLDLDRLVAGDVVGNDVVPPLDVAPFLDGFEIPDAANFAHWTDGHRARLLPHIRDALVQLMDHCRRTGDFRRIEDLAEYTLTLDELSEAAIRAKMEARAFAGDRVGALKIFETWRKKLAETLDAVPSALLEGIALRLRRRGWEQHAESPIAAVATDQWKGRPFVGRAREYKRLHDAWERARHGGRGHALVLGDSGIGKSTLVERLTTAAALEGAAVSRVQCYELEHDIPYAAIGGLLHGLLAQPGVAATPPEALAELGETVREIRRRYPNLPPAPESHGETARIRLAEAAYEMIKSVADEQPVALVLDDIHLADDASLAVIHLLIRKLREERVVVLLTARPGELRQAAQATRLRESAVALSIDEIQLAPMEEVESDGLLNYLIPATEPQPSSGTRAALIRGARGVPMVLELLAKDWQTNREDSLALSVDAMTRMPGAPASPTEAYRRLVDRLIGSLDSNAKKTLSLAALLGSRLNEIGLYELIDISVGDAMTAMATLSELRLLRSDGEKLEFVNELIRAHVYLAVPPMVRTTLHGALADRLIEADQCGELVSGFEVAWHCTRAGRTVEAAPYLFRGAREALDRGAPHEAERALEPAIPQIEATAKGEAIVLLAEALQEQGRWNDIVTKLSTPNIDGISTCGRLVTLLRMQALTRVNNGDADQIVGWLTHCLSEIRQGDDVRVQLTAARAASTIVSDRRNTKWAEETLNVLPLIPTSDLTDVQKTQLDLARAKILFRAGRGDEALKELEVATHRLAGSLSLPLADALLGIGAMLQDLGRYGSALEPSTRAFSLAVRLNNDGLVARSASTVARSFLREGRYKDAVEWSGIALRHAHPRIDAFSVLAATYSQATALAFDGELAKAKVVAHTLDAGAPCPAPAWLQQVWHLYLADIFWLAGDVGRAVTHAVIATSGDNAELHSEEFAGTYCRWLVLRADSIKEASEALKLVSSARGFSSLDKASILIALRRLRRKLGLDLSQTEDELKRVFLTLPNVVREQLDRLDHKPPLLRAHRRTGPKHSD